MTRTTRITAIISVFLGILAIVGSLTTVYLDSTGYWDYPKDLPQALLASRAFQALGLTIQGLQLFHVLVAGAILLVLGGSHLWPTRIGAQTVPVKEGTPTQTVSGPEQRIRLLEQQTQDLSLRLREYERRPSLWISCMLLVLGSATFVSATSYPSPILTFIGLGLTLWGALLLYVRPTRFVKGSLLTPTAISSLAAIDQTMKELGLEGKAVYLPPTHLAELKGGRAFISKVKGFVPPVNERGEIISENPGGLYLTPPGLALANLYEDQLGKDFAKTDLGYLQSNLPRLFIEDLEICENIEIQCEGAKIHVKTEGSIYQDLYKETEGLSPNICNSLGCPLMSSVAVAIARTTGKPLIMEESGISADGRTLTVSFKLLGTVEPEEGVGAEGKVKPYSRLVGLFLSIFGTAVLAWVGWLTLFDVTVWAKNVTLYSFLIGSLLLALGVIAFLRWRPSIRSE